MRLQIVAGLMSALVVSGFADDVPLRKMKARTLELNVPATWKEMESSSSMRAAQFSISGEDEKTADLIIFYFGGPTGGVKANVNRWVGQFDEKDRKFEMTQGKCAAGTYVWIDAIGTWNKPDGPPFAQKKIATPDSRVINVIVVEEKDDEKDYYFLKLSGPKKLVTKHVEALQRSIGVLKESESPFELKDVPN